MTREVVEKIVESGAMPFDDGPWKIVETHISLLVLGNEYVFKMKKPVHYSFLDFSTLEKRQYYCWEELRLNKRLAPRIYLDVLPITREGDAIQIACSAGEIIDYAVMMKRMPEGRQMDLMLTKEVVSRTHIEMVAQVLADFHERAEIIEDEVGFQDLWTDFEDLNTVIPFLTESFGENIADDLQQSLQDVEQFLKGHRQVIMSRNDRDMIRDVHGDLHAKNIFLLKEPIIFDCIEFSAAFRQIDLLNDIAFLVLDLLYFNRKDLADHFLDVYLNVNPAIENPGDFRLFLYYCLYRANVKMKVYSLKAQQEDDPSEIISSIQRYLNLYRYFGKLLKDARHIREVPDRILSGKYEVPG